MKKYQKQGSVIAITLVFIAILMATVIGVSFLLAKLLSSGGLVVDGIKAGYNAESGLEVALYQLKMRREGFEDKREMNLGEGKADYSIAYKTAPLTPITHTFNKGNDTLSLALYRDIPTKSTITDINEASYDVKVNFKQKISNTPTPCAKLRLIGRTGDTYEAISKTYNCSLSSSTTSILGDRDDSARLLDTPSGSSVTSVQFGEFIRNHKEVKVEIKDLKQDDSNPLEMTLVTGLGASSKEIASLRKVVTATGSSGNVTVKKLVDSQQDQVLSLLTNSFSWTK